MIFHLETKMTTGNQFIVAFLLTIFTLGLCDDAMTCFNMTVHSTDPRTHSDVTMFDGAPTVTCEDNFGCSKTLITKAGTIVGVTRGCGIYGCLGRSCFNLHGHRMCLHCCRTPNCNGAPTTAASLSVAMLSLAAGWLLTRHC